MSKLDEKEQAQLIEEARKRGPMTDEERREQAASFVFGNLALTSSYEDATHDQLEGLRQLCRRFTGCAGTWCDKPPPGWWCSREKDHKGPCAARRKL